MVFVVRYAGIAHIEGKGHQEELHSGPQQPCPLPAEPRLHIELGVQRAAMSSGACQVHPRANAQMVARGQEYRRLRASSFYEQTT